MRLEIRWTSVCERTGLDGTGQWRLLESAYSHPERAYHNLGHVEDCLEHLDAVSGNASNRDALEFAIWFHDLVYDSKKGDNEMRSAEAAVCFLKGQAIENEVFDLIMATKHDSSPRNPDGELICDIDLSILGRDQNCYRQYAEAIREEYHWVSEEEYRSGRAKVLRMFLNRGKIYRHPFFSSRYEEQARLNLEWELGSLRAGRR